MTHALHLCFGGPIVRVGRWLVEVHRYCGPIVLRRDGEPRVRQPGGAVGVLGCVGALGSARGGAAWLK